MAEQVQTLEAEVEQRQATPSTLRQPFDPSTSLRAGSAQDKAQDSAFEVPEELPILPLRGAVLYPLTVSPLVVTEARSIKLVDEAALSKRPIGMVAVKEDDVEKKEVEPEDLHDIGTVAVIQYSNTIIPQNFGCQ